MWLYTVLYGTHFGEQKRKIGRRNYRWEGKNIFSLPKGISLKVEAFLIFYLSH